MIESIPVILHPHLMRYVGPACGSLSSGELILLSAIFGQHLMTVDQFLGAYYRNDTHKVSFYKFNRVNAATGTYLQSMRLADLCTPDIDPYTAVKAQVRPFIHLANKSYLARIEEIRAAWGRSDYRVRYLDRKQQKWDDIVEYWKHTRVTFRSFESLSEKDQQHVLIASLGET